MKEKSKLFKIKLLFITSIFLLVIGAWFLLLWYDIQNQQKRLYETVESQAFLIFQGGRPENLPKDSTIRHLTGLYNQLNRSVKGFGKTGEFVLGRLKNDTVFFYSGLPDQYNTPQFAISLNKTIPIWLSLTQPKSGTLIGKDYKHKFVIAAYKPIPSLGLGLVAKIDLQELIVKYLIILICLMIAAAIIILVFIMIIKNMYKSNIKELKLINEKLNAEITVREKLQSEVLESEQRYALGLTEQKKSFEMIEMLRQSIDCHYDGAYWMNTDNRFIYVNEAGCRVLGYTLEEMLRMHVSHVNPTATDEKLSSVWEKLREQKFFIAQSVHRRKDGSEFPVEISTTYVKFENQEFNCGFARDITERKQTEETLKESEERYRAVIETTDTGYVVLDEQGRVIDANFNYVRLTGYDSLLDILDKHITEWIAPYDLERNQSEVIRCYETGIVKNLEIDYQQPDGVIIPVEINAHSVKTQNGIVIVSLCRDITLRKQTEEILQESEEKFRRMFETSRDFLFLTTMDGRIIDVNQSASTLSGYSLEELKGMKIQDLYLNTGDRDVFLKKISEQGFVENLEIMGRKKDGTIAETLVTSTLVKNKNGKVTGLQGSIKDISERKRVEAALRESEERFRMIFEQAQFGLTIADSRFRFITANPAFCKMIGYTAKELSTLTFANITPAYRVEIDTINAEAMSRKEKKQYVTEKQYLKKDGSLFWGSLVSTPVHDNEENIICYISMIQDINEKKYIEDALSESQEKFRSIFENSAAGVALVGLDGRYMMVNPAFCEIFGYSAGELLTFDLVNNTHPDDIEITNKIVDELLNNRGKGLRYATRYIHKDGHVIWAEVSSVLVFDANDKPFYFIKHVIDNTKRRLAEDEIRRHNMQLQGLLRISQFKAKDIQGLLDYAMNEAIELTESKLGYIFLYDEITKKLTHVVCSNIIKNECKIENPQIVYDLDRVGRLGIVVQKGKPYINNNYEKNNEDEKGLPKGHLKLNKLLALPIIVDGKIVATIGVGNKPSDYDHTDTQQLIVLVDSVWKMVEKQKFQEELIIAKEKAEESDKLKSAFLANMSHEIRTPMNAILGFSQLLTQSDQPEDKKVRFSNLIRDRALDLLRIIEDILDISKIEIGQMILRESQTNIGDTLQELYSYYQNRMALKHDANFKFSLEIDPQLKNLNIQIDGQRLKQILMNFLDNAFKFTFEGHITLGCTMYSLSEILFSVSDTGIGIPPDKQDVIFDRFRQADEAVISRKYGGTGLGLSIAKGLSDLMGGKIWLKSEINAGTTFFFSVPYKYGVVSEIEQKDTIGLIDVVWDHKTFLVVEDDEGSAEFLNEILSVTKAKIINVFTGKEAIEVFNVNPNIDLVLLDIRLPDESGFDVARAMKKIRPEIPIIAQTAYTSNSDKIECLNAGCNDFIAKPIQYNKLMELLVQYLGKNGHNLKNPV